MLYIRKSYLFNDLYALSNVTHLIGFLITKKTACNTKTKKYFFIEFVKFVHYKMFYFSLSFIDLLFMVL